MSRLIDIDDERFWDVLFDEACVEGNQAECIKKELEKIISFDTEKVVEKLEALHDLVNINQKLAVSQSIDIVKKGGVE